MSNFKPGDLVVCVDPAPAMMRYQVGPASVRLKKGEIYTVACVSDAPPEYSDLVGLWLEEIPDTGYSSNRFRPISQDRAEEFRQIEALERLV